MNIRNSVWDVPAAKVGLGLFLGAIVVGLIGRIYAVPLTVLVRDPAAEFDFPSYAGLLSHIGIGLMVATSAVTCFAAAALVRFEGRYNKTLFSTALFSALLAIDDLFMLHELASRLGEVVFFFCLGLALVAIVYSLRRTVKGRDLRGLYWALGFLGLSAVSDLLKVHGPFAYWLEDFSKLAGMGGWLAFWSGYSMTELLPAKSARV